MFLSHLLAFYIVYSIFQVEMDKENLLRQIVELRRSMFNEGILNESSFLNLEMLEETQPNFVEDIIGTYFSSSAAHINEMQHILNTQPLDLGKVEHLIYNLKGVSTTIGATKVHSNVRQMSDLVRARALDGLRLAFEQLKTAHTNLKAYLEPYAELLRQLRLMDPPDLASDNQEDAESVDSNDFED